MQRIRTIPQKHRTAIDILTVHRQLRVGSSCLAEIGTLRAVVLPTAAHRQHNFSCYLLFGELQ